MMTAVNPDVAAQEDGKTTRRKWSSSTSVIVAALAVVAGSNWLTARAFSRPSDSEESTARLYSENMAGIARRLDSLASKKDIEDLAGRITIAENAISKSRVELERMENWRITYAAEQSMLMKELRDTMKEMNTSLSGLSILVGRLDERSRKPVP